MWLLGIEFRSSGRTVSALNFWAISPGPPFYILIPHLKIPKCIIISDDQNFRTLSTRVDQDIKSTYKDCRRQLEKQVDSLVELVSQSHRGLDTLLLKEGGLYVTLNVFIQITQEL